MNGCDNPTHVWGHEGWDCVWNKDGDSGRVLLIGDSNAGQFSEAMIDAAESNDLELEVATMSGCPFIDAELVGAGTTLECSKSVSRTLQRIQSDPPDIVVVANASDGYISDDSRTLVDPGTGERASTPSARARVYGGAYERVLADFGALGISTGVIGVIPRFDRWDPQECASIRVMLDSGSCAPASFRLGTDENRIRAQRIERKATFQARARMIDFDDTLCPRETCQVIRDGSWIWRDSEHLSVAGSESIGSEMGVWIASLSRQHDGAPNG